MKNLIKGIIVLVVFSFSGCEKVKELTYFNIDQSAEFTIPATEVPGLASVPSVPVENNADMDFENNNTEAKYVEEIKLQEMKLSVMSPDGRNFNFLNEIEIYINAPGVEEKLLAYKYEVPENVTSFNLETTGEKVDDYIKSDSYSLRIRTVTDEILTQEVKLKSDMSFKVRAKVL